MGMKRPFYLDCSEEFRAIMRQQVERWENDGILAEAEPSKRRLLYLMAGDLPRFFENERQWMEVLGGLLWYTP